MRIQRLFKLSCSEAVQFCDKAQYKEAGFIDRLKLRLHFAICETCRKYHRANGKLTALIKKSGIQTCTEEEKEHYRKQIEAATSKTAKEQ